LQRTYALRFVGFVLGDFGSDIGHALFVGFGLGRFFDSCRIFNGLFGTYYCLSTFYCLGTVT